MLSENLFLILIALIWIIAAVIQDFRKREIANWWNFSLIAVALAYRGFISVWIWNFGFFIYGLFGLGIFIGFAYLLYYGRIFAGGDAKLLMGVGAALPFYNLFYTNVKIFLYFILLLMFCGGIYGACYSIILSYKHRKAFSKEFLKQLKNNKKFILGFVALAILSMIIILFAQAYLLSLFSLIIIGFPFLYVYAKSIEESCMIKEVQPAKLTLGDWLYKEIKIGKKLIKPSWEGLSEKELAVLKKSRKKVLLKEGIPFTPAFFFAFIVLIWFLQRNMLDLFYSLGI